MPAPLSVTLLMSIPLVVACGSPQRAPANDTPVIVISIDTLRSDRLPAYGYQGVSTPAIDALRRDSILYQRAYAHCPLTLPSHATMFTGRLPADTGVRDNVGFRLNDTTPTIAEAVRKNGYATGGAVSTFVLRKETGIARGFDFYDDSFGGGIAGKSVADLQRAGHKTVDAATHWIQKRSAQPFFFFLHLYEPHTPYTPPEPFRSRYASRYDGEIAHVDHVLGRFLQFLKERDIYDRALIILTSDHGEGLGEHGEQEHGIFLYREAIQIPLFVKLPGRRRAGDVVSVPVQLIDLFPTIARFTNTKTAAVDPSARSLLDVDSRVRRSIFSEAYYSRYHFGWSELHSLIDGKHHLIEAPQAELYDVERDPRERDNVISDRRRAYARMRALLRPLVHEATAPAAINPEDAAKLAALGYLGAAVTMTGEPLPDPKDKIAMLDELKAAFALFHTGKYDEALAAFEALLKTNPRMLDLLDIRARTLMKLGRDEEALAAAKEALRLSPGTTHLQIMTANLALSVGRYEEAVEHAELALGTEPAQAHEVRARVWLSRGRADEAAREARLALKERGDRVAPLLTLSRIAAHEDDHAAALRHADEAAAALRQQGRPFVIGINSRRGDALARLGRLQEAERAFRDEMRLFPHDPEAYRDFILLCVAQGRVEDATRLVFELTRVAPTAQSYVAVVQTLRAVGDDNGARYWTGKAIERFPRDMRVRKVARLAGN